MRTALLSLIPYALASSLELEAVIYVSDTMRGAAEPTAMAFDSVRNLVYVAGTSSEHIVAVDGASGAKVAHFPLDAIWTVSALCYRPATNRLYCFSSWSAEARVVGVTGGAEPKVVTLSAPVSVVMYNPATSRLYCASPSTSTVDVVDCETDSVCATIPLPGGVDAMCLSRVHGKLYFLNRSHEAITVVDGTADSILSVVSVSEYPFSLCSDEQGERIYCGTIDRNGLYVIDAARDSVLALIPGGRALVGLCFSSTSNRLYCADSSRHRIYIFDPSTLTFLDSLPAGDEPWYVSWSPTLNRVYAVNRDDRSVSVLDCARGSIVATVDVNLRANGIMGNAAGTMLYYLSTRNNGLALIDSLNVLSAVVRFGVGPQSITGNRAGTEVYVGVKYSDSLHVVDCATNACRGVWFSQLGTAFLLYSPAQDKLYGAGGSDYFTILAAGPDTLLRQWRYDGYPSACCYNPKYDKVYVGGELLAVYDGPTNGVLAEITLGDGEVAALACDALTGKVYLSIWSEEYVLVLDGLRNTILDTVFDTPDDGFASAVDTGARRVYFADYNNCQVVTIVDTDRDSFVRTVELGDGQAEQLACDQVRHRLYCAGYDDTITVVDCLGDTVVAQASAGPVETMLCDDRAGRLYTVGYDDTLRVLDGGTLETLGKIAVGGGTHYMYLNPLRDRLYVTSTNTSAVYVIRCGVGVAEPVTGTTVAPRAVQSVFRGPVFSTSSEPVDILDAGGRRVAVLPAGGTLSIPAGVYFLVAQRTGAGRRVVVVK